MRAGSTCGSKETKKGEMHEGRNNRKRAHTLLLSTIYEELHIKASHLLQKKKKTKMKEKKAGKEWLPI